MSHNPNLEDQPSPKAQLLAVGDPELERKNSNILESGENVWYNSEIIYDADRGAIRKITLIVLICFFFLVFEAVGAYFSNSIAIFTDVSHLVSDLIGFLFSLFALSLTTKKSSFKYSYGFVRAEVVGALFSVVLIWGLTIWICYQAIGRLITKDYENVNPSIMLITSVGALFVNLAMVYFLHDSSAIHIHSHQQEDQNSNSLSEHCHDDNEYARKENPCPNKEDEKPNSQKNPRLDNPELVDEEDLFLNTKDEPNFNSTVQLEEGKAPQDEAFHQQKPSSKIRRQEQIESKKPVQENINIRTAWIHIMGDLVQTIGIVIAACIIFFTNGYKFLDPLLSISFSIIAVGFSLPVLKDILLLLLDSSPKNIDVERFNKEINNLDLVTEVLDLHVWLLAYGKPIMTAYVICEDDPDSVTEQVKKLANSKGIYHTTIQTVKNKNYQKHKFEHNVHPLI